MRAAAIGMVLILAQATLSTPVRGDAATLVRAAAELEEAARSSGHGPTLDAWQEVAERHFATLTVPERRALRARWASLQKPPITRAELLAHVRPAIRRFESTELRFSTTQQNLAAKTPPETTVSELKRSGDRYFLKKSNPAAPELATIETLCGGVTREFRIRPDRGDLMRTGSLEPSRGVRDFHPFDGPQEMAMLIPSKLAGKNWFDSLESVLEDESTVVTGGLQRIDDFDCVEVVTGIARLYLAMRHDYAVVRMDVSHSTKQADGKPSFKRHWTIGRRNSSLIQPPNGPWLPAMSEHYAYDEASKSARLVSSTRLEAADFGRPLDNSVFEDVFPVHTLISDFIAGKSYLVELDKERKPHWFLLNTFEKAPTPVDPPNPGGASKK